MSCLTPYQGTPTLHPSTHPCSMHWVLHTTLTTHTVQGWTLRSPQSSPAMSRACYCSMVRALVVLVVPLALPRVLSSPLIRSRPRPRVLFNTHLHALPPPHRAPMQYHQHPTRTHDPLAGYKTSYGVLMMTMAVVVVVVVVIQMAIPPCHTTTVKSPPQLHCPTVKAPFHRWIRRTLFSRVLSTTPH